MASKKSYLLVCSAGDSDQLRSTLAGAVGPLLDSPQAIFDFNLPSGPQTPKFGSFDNLIKLTDDLAKCDSTTEGCLRRLERQYIETFETEEEKKSVDNDENTHFIVYTGAQKTEKRLDVFLREGFQWDEAKYPGQRSLQQNVEHLMAGVQKLDEDCRNHGQAYSDVKGQRTVVAKKVGVAYPTADLVDVLHPAVVQPGDFVETEHLTTVVVILNRGQDVEFKKWYQDPQVTTSRTKDGVETKHVDEIEGVETVIPGSLQQFTSLTEGAEDKDGNTVWRVVLFKSCKDKFASLARQNKFTVRDFEYNPSALGELEKKRKETETETDEKLNTLKKFCKLAWSDVFNAWLHIKALRAFVECVLRNGKDSKTKFAGFVICPKAVNPALREALARVIQGPGGDVSDEGEEYFPYVSLGFAPRAAVASA